MGGVFRFPSDLSCYCCSTVITDICIFNCSSKEKIPLHAEEKLLIFKSCLWELFETCPVCSRPCLVETVNRKGTMVKIKWTCTGCQRVKEWSTQPTINDVPAGNILLSAAILACGASPAKVLRVLDPLNVLSISISPYRDHVEKYVHPTIWHVWKVERDAILEQLQVTGQGLQLGCDGRNDSPGHSAKFGSYTMMETRINKVIDVQLVQVSQINLICLI